MIRIGMIGESEYDRQALQCLLEKHYEGKLQFVPFLKKVRGTQLDQEKTLDILEQELTKRHVDAIIIQRDLDAPESHKEKNKARDVFFNRIRSKTECQNFCLLHIQALEALILADLDGFNKRFNTKASFSGSPMHVDRPKRWLSEKCKKDKYEAKHSPELFATMDIQKLKSRVLYFKKFIIELEEYLNKAA